MIRTVIISLLVAAPLAIPAAAAPKNATAQNAAEVRSLETYTSVALSDGGAFIELAQAYVRDDRLAEAAVAYRRALALDNVMLTTPTGDSIWSHNVARLALARVTQFSAK